jgi:ribonuclease J
MFYHYDGRTISTNGEAFAVTPYLIDHSGFDAVAYLIEADGKRLFYSSDFRGHGRKSMLFDLMLANPPLSKF